MQSTNLVTEDQTNMTPNQDASSPLTGWLSKDVASTLISAGENNGRLSHGTGSTPGQSSSSSAQLGSSQSHRMRQGNTYGDDQHELPGLASRSVMHSGRTDGEFPPGHKVDLDASKVKMLVQEAIPGIIAEIESHAAPSTMFISEQKLKSYINAEVQKAQALQAQSLRMIIQDEVAKAVQSGSRMDKVGGELDTLKLPSSHGGSGLLWPGKDSSLNELDEARKQVSALTRKSNGLQESVKEKAKSIRNLRQQVQDLLSASDTPSCRSDSLERGKGNDKESELMAENQRLSHRVRELEQKVRSASQVQLGVSALESFQAMATELGRKVDCITLESERTRYLEEKVDEVTQERDEARTRAASLEDQVKVATETQSNVRDPRKRARRDSSNLSEDMVVFGNACEVLASNLREIEVQFLEPSIGSAPRGSDLVYALASFLRYEGGHKHVAKVKNSSTSHEWKCYGNICAFPLDDPLVTARVCGCIVVIPSQRKCLQVRVMPNTEIHEFCFQDVESSQSSE